MYSTKVGLRQHFSALKSHVNPHNLPTETKEQSVFFLRKNHKEIGYPKTNGNKPNTLGYR